ncbi:MAG TPA: hypothetical protein VGE30_00740 [Candidatus Saccharimonadales bacterium]
MTQSSTPPEPEQDYFKSVARRTIKAVVIIAAVIFVIVLGLVVLLAYLINKVLT